MIRFQVRPIAVQLDPSFDEWKTPLSFAAKDHLLTESNLAIKVEPELAEPQLVPLSVEIKTPPEVPAKILFPLTAIEKWS